MARRKKYANGKFTPSYPEKYVGPSEPRYRSSWELKFMRFIDAHPSIVSWASEPIKIPYLNPVTRKASIYIPDFLLVYSDINGKRHQEIVEVKPAKETLLSEAKTKGDKLRYAMNMAKWKAAAAYCKKHGLQFRVINENEIFGVRKKKKKK